jgi:hypothetical protein
MQFSVQHIDLFERDVRLRMPFRFGIVTLTEAPQAFARARIRLENGKQAEGAAAELLAPKWFDKNPALTNEDNFEQLRTALRIAREAYLAGGSNTAFGHFTSHYAGQIASGAKLGLNSLAACYGPALIDRALLDALCRALGISFYDAMRRNVPGLDNPDYLETLEPGDRIAARHTVGLVDPITAADLKERVNDGLPETLEEVVGRYGHRWFKLKVGGDVNADIERLDAIAAVLDRVASPYRASLDGNEQYDDIAGVLELWQRMKLEPRLERLVASVAFIEQPIKRQNALSADVSALGSEKPVIIDESDDSLDAFPRAKALGYTGVSSKTCKGALLPMEPRGRRAALLHDRRGPDDPGGARAAAGPGARLAPRPHPCRAQRASLRERHGERARARAGGVPQGASRPVRAQPWRGSRAHPQWRSRNQVARLQRLCERGDARLEPDGGDET